MSVFERQDSPVDLRLARARRRVLVTGGVLALSMLGAWFQVASPRPVNGGLTSAGSANGKLPAPSFVKVHRGSKTVTEQEAVAVGSTGNRPSGTSTFGSGFTPSNIRPDTTTDTWTGGSGGDWSNGANWSSGAPANGDDLSFPVALTSTDDMAGLSVNTINWDGGTVSDGGHALTLNGLSDTQTSVEGDEFDVASIVAGTTPLPLTTNAADVNIRGTISGAAQVDTSNSGDGIGSERFWNPNTYTGGTVVQSGALFIDNSQASGTTVDSDGFLGGSGNAGALTVDSGGAVFPGEPLETNADTLSTTSLNLPSGSDFFTELDGPTVTSQYTSINASGAVTLGGSLFVFLTYPAAYHQTFTLIHNTSGSAVTGTFNNLPEGAKFMVNSSLFQITYSGGGTGHDVVITSLGAAPVFTGAGFASLLALNSGSAWMMTSNGTQFNSPTAWSNTAFYGNRTTLTGDVDGDGKTDLMAINNTSVWVEKSTGSGFGAPTQWSSVPFYGTRATIVADVNGDGMADLVAINDTSVWVMTSTGTGFNAPVQWSSTPFYGNRTTLVGDVNGDGNSDLMAINNTSVWILTSNGNSFNAPEQWSSTAFYGNLNTMVGDISGDGMADLLAVNSGSVWVMISNGSSFDPPVQASNVPFYGTSATLLADVNGDGAADLIAVNPTSSWVMTSTGSSFNAPAQWSSLAFTGNRAMHAG